MNREDFVEEIKANMPNPNMLNGVAETESGFIIRINYGGILKVEEMTDAVILRTVEVQNGRAKLNFNAEDSTDSEEDSESSTEDDNMTEDSTTTEDASEDSKSEENNSEEDE